MKHKNIDVGPILQYSWV